MVFLIMNSIDIQEGVKMLMMITTNFVKRLHEDVIDRRCPQVKGMIKRKVNGTEGMTQIPRQACCPKRNDMMWKDQRKLSSSSKIVFQGEGPGSTVKMNTNRYSRAG